MQQNSKRLVHEIHKKSSLGGSRYTYGNWCPIPYTRKKVLLPPWETMFLVFLHSIKTCSRSRRNILVPFNEIIIVVIIIFIWVQLPDYETNIISKIIPGNTKNVLTLHISLGKNQGLFLFSKVSITIRWVNLNILKNFLP